MSKQKVKQNEKSKQQINIKSEEQKRKELLDDLGLNESEDENQDQKEDFSDQNQKNSLNDNQVDSEENESDQDPENEQKNDQEDQNQEQEQEQDLQQQEEVSIEDKVQQKKIKMEELKEFQDRNNQKGVCYLSRIPPYMKVSFIRKLLAHYGVERIYLVPEAESKYLMRVQKGGNPSKSFTEGWIEFSDKRVAKMAALTLNCSKMGNWEIEISKQDISRKGSFYSDDLWNIKYLPKFKWENLTQKFAYDERVRKEKLKAEIAQSKKELDFYQEKQDQSKIVMGIKKRKLQQIQKQGNDSPTKIHELEQQFIKKKQDIPQSKPAKTKSIIEN